MIPKMRTQLLWSYEIESVHFTYTNSEHIRSGNISLVLN